MNLNKRERFEENGHEYVEAIKRGARFNVPPWGSLEEWNGMVFSHILSLYTLHAALE